MFCRCLLSSLGSCQVAYNVSYDKKMYFVIFTDMSLDCLCRCSILFSCLQEHFYDPSSHSGFLEMRLRNIRRKLEAGQRRYTKRNKGCDTGRDATNDYFHSR